MTGTFDNENSLPNLPVPELGSTVEQLLAAIKPMVSEEEYDGLVRDAADFQKHELIATIQSHLKALSKNHLCYLNAIHNEIYSDLRGDVLPRNPYLVLEDDPYSKTLTPLNQVQRASSLINSALKFILSLRRETLKPDLTPKNGNPLSMNCYHSLFGTTRVPGDHKSLATRTCRESCHLVVVCNNQYYKVTVLPLDNSSIYFNDHELALQLQSIVSDAALADDLAAINSSFGSLTTQTFGNWKAARMEMQKANAATLETIDTALFIVVLDMSEPTTVADKISVVSTGSSDLLPGTNVQIGSCTSRWYDKLQLVVTKNSVAGFVWDSVSVDSTAILRFIGDIYTDSILKLAKNINGSEYTLFDDTIAFVSSADAKPEPEKLQFLLTRNLAKMIHHAETRLTDLISQHEYKSLNIHVNTHLVSKFNISIDLFLQMCFQIAHYSLYGRIVNSLEPVTTRKFRDSRTELITVQNETVERLVKRFISGTPSADTWELFKECCQQHTVQYLNAMHGQGFDRHFFSFIRIIKNHGLVEYCNRENPHLPPIDPSEYDTVPLLSNPLIEKLTLPEMLISNCGNNSVHLFGIPPAIDQGFSIGYIVHSDKITITVSSKFRQTERFLNTFERVVKDFKTIIVENSQDVLLDINDSNIRKLEITRLKIQKELDNVSDLPSRRHPINLKLNIDNPHSLSLTEPLSHTTSADTVNADYDLLGGYDYFDFEQLKTRSLTISRNESLVDVSSDMQRKMSLSQSIRDKMDEMDERPNKIPGRSLEKEGYWD